MSCFPNSVFFQQEKVDTGPKRDIDGMGVPEIKYGDSVCFVMHVATGLWLSYMAPDAKSSRLGPLKRRVKLPQKRFQIKLLLPCAAQRHQRPLSVLVTYCRREVYSNHYTHFMSSTFWLHDQ